jgi:hypothetical protein
MANPQFRTSFIPEKSSLSIHHNQSVILFGSCFSAHIGERLEKSGFNCQINPFGVLYNPISIAHAIERCSTNRKYSADELMQHQGLWLSPDHHGSYSKPEQTETLQEINDEIATAHSGFQQNPLLLITLGSAHVYRDKQTHRIVGNCHKIPARNFTKELLAVEAIVEKFTACLNHLFGSNPSLQVVFTISPVRYLSDGFFENQLSKAILHLSVAKLMEQFPEAHYFPAYEIMMDDLRDYRFYTDDMLHPSPVAVDYIWEQFGKTYFSPETHRLTEEIMELHKAAEHRPFQKESEAYRTFLNKQIQKIDRLQQQHPQLNLSELRCKFEKFIKP